MKLELQWSLALIPWLSILVSSSPLRSPPAFPFEQPGIERQRRESGGGACRIQPEYRCDGELDCLDQQDERGCRKCAEKEVSCMVDNKPSCVPESAICDMKRQCDDGSDEFLCRRLVGSSHVKEYETIRRMGDVQIKYEGKWHYICIRIDYIRGTPKFNIHEKRLVKEICDEIVGEDREVGDVLSVRIFYSWRASYLKMSATGELKPVRSCIGRVGHVVCAKPLPTLARHRRSVDNPQYPTPLRLNLAEGLNRDASQEQPPSEDDDGQWEAMSRIFEEEGIDMRIVGGDEAAREDWPFIVSINICGAHFCGGIILSESWVLTAAHCLFGWKSSLNSSPIEVQAGMLRLSSTSPFEQSSLISQVVFHPGYDMRSSDNDVMLIKLRTPFQLNKWVRPLQLGTDSNMTGKHCTTAGWGLTKERGQISDTLQSVTVPVHGKCPSMYRVPNAHFLCAGYHRGGKDSCQGDSGGPLVCPSNENGWQLYGIVSFGIGCARRGYPGAYASVPFYFNWITSVMEGKSTAKVFTIKSSCHRSCRRSLGSCLCSTSCAERNECWEVERRCTTRSSFETEDSSLYSTPPEEELSKPCPEGMLPCLTTDECFDREKRCDRTVDCRDHSDELNCTCRMSTPREYLCDSYIDCPDFSDERECDEGCEAEGIWCFKNGVKTCVRKELQCDGTQHCDDNEDEHLCMRLVSNALDLGNSAIQRKGYLQVKKDSRWYPLSAKRTQSYTDLTTKVCGDIVGYQSNATNLYKFQIVNTTKSQLRARLWMRYSKRTGKMFRSTGQSGIGLFVVCAQPKCGYDYHGREKRGGYDFLSAPSRPLIKSSPLQNAGIRAGMTGVVINRDAEPETWGPLVMVLREGVPVCLGAIIDAHWIITSATCVQQYDGYFYEVKAGMLRISSTSPYEQLSPVSQVHLHDQGALALIKLEKPLHMNRWVRPVCKVDSAAVEDDTKCMTAGWTDTHGNKTNDHLQEIDLRTVTCLSSSETDVCVQGRLPERSCASVPGAPLMCRRYDDEWMLSGVALGECTEEVPAGVYTRISSLAHWIDNRQNLGRSATSPRNSCAAANCLSSLGSCQSNSSLCNGQIDCLNGRDETVCSIILPLSLEDQGAQGNEVPVVGNVHELVAMPFFGEEVHLSRSNTTDICEGDVFKCTIIDECIPQSLRCDGTPQCRDQSDEYCCTCLERLRTTNPDLENDGYYDCYDRSDEYTSVCPEFTCETSRKCIPEKKACNGVVDCYYGEDEINCLGLLSQSQESSLIGLLDLSEERSSKGLVMHRQGTTWKPVCLKDVNPNLIPELCSYLGYSSQGMHIDNNVTNYIEILYETKFKISPNNESVISFPASSKDESPYWRESGAVPVIPGSAGEGMLSLMRDIVKQNADGGSHCKSNVECGEEQCGLIPRFLFNEDVPVWKIGGVPWAGSIYVDGEYQCGGTLVHPSWILTSAACMALTDLSESHVSAVMGSWRKVGTKTRLWSAYEHDRRVDYMAAVPESDILALHLEKRMSRTRYINNLCLPDSAVDVPPNSTCVIAGLSEEDGRLSLGIDFRVSGCAGGALYIADDLSNAPCMGKWSGVIACKSGSSNAWVGAGMWSSKECGQTGIQPLRHMLFTANDLQNLSKIFDKYTDIRPLPDVCDGEVCATGVCVTEERKCDMRLDCPDQADELHVCPPPTSLCTPDLATNSCVCANGMACPDKVCVPADNVCDGVDHCLDGSDEQNCSCIERLPSSQICDGVIHCQEEEDEKNCSCAKKSEFRCYDSSGQPCIDKENVCDGKHDCAGGEDERFCLALSPWVFVIENALGKPASYREGFLLIRLRGLWFTYSSKYWARNTHLSRHLCRKLGYPDAVATFSRPLDMQQVVEMGTTLAASYSGYGYGYSPQFDPAVLHPGEDDVKTPVVYVVCEAE